MLSFMRFKPVLIHSLATEYLFVFTHKAGIIFESHGYALHIRIFPRHFPPFDYIDHNKICQYVNTAFRSFRGVFTHASRQNTTTRIGSSCLSHVDSVVVFAVVCVHPVLVFPRPRLFLSPCPLPPPRRQSPWGKIGLGFSRLWSPFSSIVRFGEISCPFSSQL